MKANPIYDLTKSEMAFVKKLMPKTYKKLYKFNITAVDANCVYTTIIESSYGVVVNQDDFVSTLGVAAKLIQFRRDVKLKTLGIG
jgi:hypothetical protein